MEIYKFDGNATASVKVEGYRSAMLKDGVAMVKFLKWLKPAGRNANTACSST